MNAQDAPDEGPVRVTVEPEIAHIVPDLVAQLAEDLRSCLDTLERGDLSRCDVVGHQMKGTGSGFGFHFVSTLGADLEAAAGRGDTDEARTLVARLQDLLERVEVVVGEV